MNSEMDLLNPSGSRRRSNVITIEETEGNPPEPVTSATAEDPAKGGTPLPLKFADMGRFLDMDEILSVLTDRERVALASVPRGVKENVYFVVENQENWNRRARSQNCAYFDDRGPWSNSNSGTSYFLCEDGVRKNVVVRNGQYCRKVEGEGKAVPLDPQPEPESILSVFRNYSKDVKCPEYERRVTWVDLPGANFPRWALYEYKCKANAATVKAKVTFKFV
jgi:hypothetical protein